MARVDPDVFDEKEVALVYIAGRISEAERVEKALTERGVDYALDIEPFQTYVLGLLPVQYEGVGFYVVTAQAELSRRLLHEAGLKEGLVDEEPR
jgi:hypothetical protein